MLGLVGGFGVLAATIALLLWREVNWPPFLAGFFATLGLAVIGAYARQAKGTPRLALGLIGVAIFMGFTAVASVFIFALFPLPRPLIDPALVAFDAQVGYHWPSVVAALAQYPAFAKAVGLLYHTSLPQIMLTILLLAALRRQTDLQRFLMVGILAMIIAVGIWYIWPSVGPSAVHQIPEDVRLATGLYFDPAYGAYLRKLVEVGPSRISPEMITGVVAFPSYHTVMACMVVWYTWRTPAFLVALLANILMPLSILTHGGHHLVDVVGGIVTFALSVLLARVIVRPVVA